MDITKQTFDILDLQNLMRRLRDPQTGCPWDIQQDFNTIKPHTIEEAYEVADAIERGNMDDLKDELGDLLFQVLFHAQMASEAKLFDLNDVIDHVTKKMIFRHPHVFGDDKARSAKDVEDRVWEAQKAQEKVNKSNNGSNTDHYLDDVTLALPSLLLANKIQKRVRKVGFEYKTMRGTLDKLAEEMAELVDACARNDQDHIEEELGDVLFASALLATDVRANPEDCLRRACLKFIGRFNRVEDGLKSQGQDLQTATTDQMITMWAQIKVGN